MTISIKHEMLVFWSIFLCGQLIFVIFDFFRGLRKTVKPSKVRVALEDIVFCILAFKIFFDTLYITNNGHMRWFVPSALICAGVIYFFTESKYVMKVWLFLFKIARIILTPFYKMYVFLKRLIIKSAKAGKTRICTASGTVFDKFGQIAAKKLPGLHKNKK